MAVVAIAGTAAALSVTEATKKIDIYGQNFSSTDFTVTSGDTFLKGKNKVTGMFG